MSFSFLAPAALGLGALVAIPILAHLTRQRPTDRVAFGAMLLVQRLVKRLRRRRTIKDPLLLLLRVLALLAVVLAAAGPRLSWQGDVPDFGGSGRVVLVVDTSMSMALHDSGGTLLARAVAEARRWIQDAPDGARFGLVAYDATSRPLTPELTDDKGLVLGLLDELQPAIHPGDLRAALLDARRMLAGEPGEVVLFTDEAGPVMIPGAREELGRIVAAGSAVLPVPIHADPPRNVAVTAADYGDGLEGGTLTLRVVNHGPTAREVPCDVRLPDGAEIPVFVDAPPLSEAEVRLTVPREARGGVGQVRCEDDDLGLDNARWFHMPDVGASRVLVVDGAPGDTPTESEVYFLERALAPWGGVQTGVRPDVVSTQGLASTDLSEHRVVFLANVSDPRPVAPRLREFVRQGGSVVIGMGSNVTAERYNAAFGGVLPTPLRSPRALAALGEDPVPLSLPDVAHDLFEPFARGGRGAFRSVGAWRVMTLEPYTEGGDVTTLLRYATGVPALVDRSVGTGHVVLWTSTFDDAWTTFPLQSVYLPLMQRLVAWLGGAGHGAVQRVDALVGQQVTVSVPEGITELTALGPGGDSVRVVVSGDEGRLTVDAPGAYRVDVADGPPLAWVAANTDPIESDVRRYDSVARVEADLEPELFTRHQELAWPALWLALALALGGASLARRVPPVDPAAADDTPAAEEAA